MRFAFPGGPVWQISAPGIDRPGDTPTAPIT